MKRLRHKETGEVYGWNHEMAKQPDLEEFDDEDPNAVFEPTPKTPDVRGPQNPMITKNIVGDAPTDEASKKAAAEAAAAGQAALDEVTSGSNSGEEEYFLADDDGNPILDTDGKQILTDAEGNQLDPTQVPASASPEPEADEPEPKRKRK